MNQSETQNGHFAGNTSEKVTCNGRKSEMWLNLKSDILPGFTGVAVVEAVAPKLNAGAGEEVVPNPVVNDISQIKLNLTYHKNTIYRARLIISYKRQCNEYGGRYAPQMQISVFAQTARHVTYAPLQITIDGIILLLNCN